MGFGSFSNVISPKVKVMARLESKLAYSEIVDKFISYYVMRPPSLNLVDPFIYLEKSHTLVTMSTSA